MTPELQVCFKFDISNYRIPTEALKHIKPCDKLKCHTRAFGMQEKCYNLRAMPELVYSH